LNTFGQLSIRNQVSSQRKEEAFQTTTICAKDRSFLGTGIDKIYVTPPLHRTIAIIPLSPLFTPTQEKTGLQLRNTENIKCCNYN